MLRYSSTDPSQDSKTYKTVFLDQICYHIPLSAITNGARQQVLYQATIEILISGINDVFKHPVRLLQLIPVEEVLLAQFELFQIVLLHNRNAEDIGRGEEPAAAGRTLVCDWGAFEGNLDVEGLGVCDRRCRELDERGESVLGDGTDCETVLCWDSQYTSVFP